MRLLEPTFNRIVIIQCPPLSNLNGSKHIISTRYNRAGESNPSWLQIAYNNSRVSDLKRYGWYAGWYNNAPNDLIVPGRIVIIILIVSTLNFLYWSVWPWRRFGFFYVLHGTLQINYKHNFFLVLKRFIQGSSTLQIFSPPFPIKRYVNVRWGNQIVSQIYFHSGQLISDVVFRIVFNSRTIQFFYIPSSLLSIFLPLVTPVLYIVL